MNISNIVVPKASGDQGVFSALAQSANDAIICSDDKDRIIIWNTAASRIFGYREDEALGKPVVMLIPERLKQAHRDGVWRKREMVIPAWQLSQSRDVCSPSSWNPVWP